MTASLEGTRRDLTGVYRRVGRHLARYWRGLALMGFFLACGSLLQVLNPWPLKFLFDGVLVGRRISLGPFGTFVAHTSHDRLIMALWIAVAYFAIIVSGVVFGALGAYTLARVALNMIHDLRGELV